MLQAVDIHKSFPGSPDPVLVLRGVSLSVAQGEFVAVVGRSGSGKSTLLNVLSSLVEPDSGQVLFEGRDIAAMPEDERNGLRRSAFAMIFQAHHLIPYLSVLENVLLPCMTGFQAVTAAMEEQARERIAAVGLSGKENALPLKLSGGEQQRVAIARGLMNGATVLFADEPTGSLDTATGDAVMALLHDLNAQGLTVVMVTHNPEYAKLAKRTVTMQEGRIV